MRFALYLALGVLVVATAYLFLRRPAPSIYPAVPGAPKPRPPSVSSDIFSKLAAGNVAGCRVAAGVAIKGLPSGLAGAGCSDFLKYATPIGWAETGISAVSHPLDTVKSIGHDLSKLNPF